LDNHVVDVDVFSLVFFATSSYNPVPQAHGGEENERNGQINPRQLARRSIDA